LFVPIFVALALLTMTFFITSPVSATSHAPAQPQAVKLIPNADPCPGGVALYKPFGGVVCVFRSTGGLNVTVYLITNTNLSHTVRIFWVSGSYLDIKPGGSTLIQPSKVVGSVYFFP
jgi:hypothetical protein